MGRAMTLATLAAFAAAILVLFMTPGPGNLAMVARTLGGGPAHGVSYGLGILTGDVFWLTLAITGLSAAAELAERQAGVVLAVKLLGAGVLFWFAWSALASFRNPQPAGAPLPRPSKRGLAGTYAAGITMPLTNPKAIVFYLSFLPAFFDLSEVTLASYAAMIAIMLAMFVVFAGVYVGLAHRARDWLAAKGVKRWADLVTAAVMAGVAMLLLLR